MLILAVYVNTKRRKHEAQAPPVFRDKNEDKTTLQRENPSGGTVSPFNTSELPERFIYLGNFDLLSGWLIFQPPQHEEQFFVSTARPQPSQHPPLRPCISARADLGFAGPFKRNFRKIRKLTRGTLKALGRILRKAFVDIPKLLREK